MAEKKITRWLLLRCWRGAGWILPVALWRGSEEVARVVGNMMPVIAEVLLTIAICLSLLWAGYSCWYWPKVWRCKWAAESEELSRLVQKDLEDSDDMKSQDWGRIKVLRRRFGRRRLRAPEEMRKEEHGNYYGFLVAFLNDGFLHAYREHRRIAAFVKAEAEAEAEAD